MKQTKEKFLHDDRGVFQFMRSIITSQISSWVDFFASFAFFAWVSLAPGVATALGAFIGGVVNCTINYRFTFRHCESSYLSIGVKFFIVWLGSLLLNTFGTAWLTYFLVDNSWMDTLGVVENLRFTIARLSTALVVSVFWNFMLQRYFVFRASPADRYIDRLGARFRINNALLSPKA